MTPRPPTRVRPQVRRSHSRPACEVVVTRTKPLLDADEDAELTAMLKERVRKQYQDIDALPRSKAATPPPWGHNPPDGPPV